MSNIRFKRCPTCNIVVKGGNEQIVSHMMKSLTCKKKLIYCVGCNKPCANYSHLCNHQRQQLKTKGNTFCIQGMNKLEKVQTLTANNPLFKNQLTNVKKRKIFSIEQPISLMPNSIPTKKSRMSKHSSMTYHKTNKHL